MNTDTLARLAQRVSDQLVSLHASWQEGLIDRAEFVSLAVAFLDASRARAVALADMGLAAEMSRLRGHIVNTLGLEAPQEPLAPAVGESLDSEQYRLDAVAAVAVLARALTLDAAQQATHDGMARHGVQMWERVTDAGSCEVCTDLAARGAAPVSVKPWHHRGCGCSTRPVA